MTRAEELYGDMMGKGRPEREEVRRRHPPMRREQRAKQFSPFAALRGFEESLEQEEVRHRRCAPVALSEEEEEKLSQTLGALRKGDCLQVRYFCPDGEDGLGHYAVARGTLAGMDPAQRVLLLECGEKQGFPHRRTPIPWDALVDCRLCPAE